MIEYIIGICLLIGIRIAMYFMKARTLDKLILVAIYLVFVLPNFIYYATTTPILSWDVNVIFSIFLTNWVAFVVMFVYVIVVIIVKYLRNYYERYKSEQVLSEEKITFNDIEKTMMIGVEVGAGSVIKNLKKKKEIKK